MDQVEFYIKLGLTFVIAATIGHLMDRIQKRKEEKARRTYEFTLKSRGMSLEIENTKKES